MMQSHLNKVSTSLRQKAACESGENWSSGFREEDIYGFQEFIPVYSAGTQGQITPREGKILILTKTFYYFRLIIHCKIKPLVLKTY